MSFVIPKSTPSIFSIFEATQYTLILKKSFYIFILAFLSQTSIAQEKGKFSLDIINWTVAGSVGSITNRVNPHFERIGFSIDAYLPFYSVVKKDPSRTTSNNGFNAITTDRVFSMRQYLSLIFNQYSSSNGFGMGNQFSFYITHGFWMDYDFGLTWVESGLDDGFGDDGLEKGLNFRHFFVVKKEINKHITLGLGIMHLSNGGFFDNETNYDMLATRFYYTF